MSHASRLGRLETLWRREGALAERGEAALTQQLVEIIRRPACCAPPEADAQRGYLHRTIAASRLPPGAVERALAVAMTACGHPEGEALAVVRQCGVDLMLQALAAQMAVLAAEQHQARERDAVAHRAAEARRKTAARAAYLALRPGASTNEFCVAYATAWRYGDDVQAWAAEAARRRDGLAG